jgi:hypothetical protein
MYLRYGTKPMSKAFTLRNRLSIALKTRLIVAGLIFAIIGWFLLGVVVYARLLGGDISGIEEFAGSSGFIWGLRIVIIITLITLLKQNTWLNKAWQNGRIKRYVYAFWIVGLLGWLTGFVDLILS